jgi:hypothetical protein
LKARSPQISTKDIDAQRRAAQNLDAMLNEGNLGNSILAVPALDKTTNLKALVRAIVALTLFGE